MVMEIDAGMADHPCRSRTRLAFIDGNAPDADIAAPLLVRHAVETSFLMLIGRLNRSGGMSTAQLADLVNGSFGVGCDAAGHVAWTTCDGRRLKVELIDARAKTVNVMAAPASEAGISFGAWDARIERRLAAIGYRRAYSSNGGRTLPLVPRLSVRTGDIAAQLCTEVTWRLGAVARATSEPRVRLQGGMERCHA